MAKTMVVASKPFTENFILAEIVAQLAERYDQVIVDRKFGMGQSDIAFTALQKGQIDIYPDYSDTVSLVLLKNNPGATYAKIQQGIENMSLVMTDRLGFGNTYAITVRAEIAKPLQLTTISDLQGHPNLKVALSDGFVDRADTKGFFDAYRLSFTNVSLLQHGLKYQALRHGKVDVADLYTTDGNIKKLDLVVLEDDQGFFPSYQAAYLMHANFRKQFPRTWKALQEKVIGKIDRQTMVALNAQVDVDKKEIAAVVETFLFGTEKTTIDYVWSNIWLRTKEHAWMVILVTLLCIVCGGFLGFVAYDVKGAPQFILLLVSMIQTIPSLALLSLLIKPFGVGVKPAMIALFLYGLLPIVRNTYDGLKNIDQDYIESAISLGLTRLQRFRFVELPLAMPYVFGGIKTSAIITIGTATLAALIGAGGYGVPIVRGLALNDMHVVLQGALPSAAMAICVHFLFELLERVMFLKQ